VKHRDMGSEEMLRAEVVQLREEGRELGDLPIRLEAAIADGTIDAKSEAIWGEMESLSPVGAGLREPSDLVGIRAARPDGDRSHAITLSDAGLYDRIYGAWLGRCAGCTLGKPVEGWPRSRIEAYLRAANAWPLRTYFPVIDPFPEGLELWKNYKETALGRVTRMPRDDDTDYTVMGLHIVETYGREFSSQDVATAWLDNLPFAKVYTAEKVAYLNLVEGMDPPQTARYHNPYREWIGAQIRADMWGYINPGNPELAAEMAYRDASLSHTANGIYGEMWAAACVAAAFGLDDPHDVISAGLAEIPSDSRLAEAVRNTMAWADECARWEDAWDRINDEYGAYHTVHVINNTCVVALGLLYGGGDLEKSICVAVMGGWDTDCTGATVGSIVGAMNGAAALPDKWVGPLDDKLTSIVYEFEDSRISDLARRTVALAEMPDSTARS